MYVLSRLNRVAHFLFKKENAWDIVGLWLIWWFWEFLRIIYHHFWSPHTDLFRNAED